MWEYILSHTALSILVYGVPSVLACLAIYVFVHGLPLVERRDVFIINGVWLVDTIILCLVTWNETVTANAVYGYMTAAGIIVIALIVTGVYWIAWQLNMLLTRLRLKWSRQPATLATTDH